MELFPHSGSFDRLGSMLYGSRRLRKALWEMPKDSRYRRSALPAFFAWCYRRVNSGESIPYSVFTEDFVLLQTAALFDSAGTFAGPRGLDQVFEEIAAAFDEFEFEPVSAIELEGERILLRVRFRAVGRGSGVALERTIGHLISIRDGCASRLEVYWEEADALEAAGLRQWPR